MDLRIQIALYAMAVMEKVRYDIKCFKDCFWPGLQWLLLPGALGCWGCPEPLTHCWESLDAWMKFPTGEVLQNMTQKILQKSLEKHFDLSKFENFVMGSDIDITKLYEHNYSHSNYRELRIHLKSDSIQYKYLSTNFVNVHGRNVGKYELWSKDSILDANQLKQELQLFDNFGFLYIVGKFHEKTKLLFNRKWMKEYVWDCLYGSYYPSDLAEKVCDAMLQIPNWMENKINCGDFLPNDTELCENGILGITDVKELVKTFDKIFGRAYETIIQIL